MINIIQKKIWVTFVVLFVFVVSGCESQEPVVLEVSKPSSVPSEAIWVGGIDGGVFVLVSESESSNEGVYFGEIYYVSGDVSYKGILKIYPDNDLSIDFHSQESYQGWDGDTLYLREGKYLKIPE